MKKLFVIGLIVIFAVLAIFPLSINKDWIAISHEVSSENLYALSAICSYCEMKKDIDGKVAWYVPGAWTIDPNSGDEQIKRLVASGDLVKPVKIGNPYKFIGNSIRNLIRFREKNDKDEIDIKTGRGVIAVNFLPRLLSMYDHDRDGYIGSELKGSALDITLNSCGFREMGTFIKNILALPYLRALGYNTVHLQPITEIGVYGRKGNLGSPFAVCNPFAIEPSLADPLFTHSVEEQYLAFIQAAHALGMKVVQEVIPRTVSLDSQILAEHPDYGYWVKEGCEKRMPDYYNSQYEYSTNEGLRRFSDRASFEKWFYDEYKKKIYSGDYRFSELIDVTKTDPDYADFFLPAPDVVKREAGGKLVGYYYKANSKGGNVEIDKTIKAEVFPAFCDTPFEIQPFWQDVTYLRLYDDKGGKMPILKPLSFVTAKFFKDVEPELEREYRNKPVWDMIKNYFNKFKNMGVDGFVLDMGHALPDDLKKEIRSVLPAVWEENLGADFPYLAAESVVITGNVFAHTFPAYNDATDMKLYNEHPEETLTFHIKKMREMFMRIEKNDVYKGKMFGSPDNYNTKRIGQSPATRDLSIAPHRKGTQIPDFTRAPVDQEKARRITLLYYTLFRLFSEKEGSPFIVNPVFGTEFIATSTINVGLNTHIDEAKQFYDYMTPEERVKNPGAPRLLLMSKPEKSSGEWTNEKHIVGEILTLNKIVDELRPLLRKNVHLAVLPDTCPEILFLSLSSEKASRLAIVSNLDLQRGHSVKLPSRVRYYYLNRSPGASERENTIFLAPGSITVFEY